MAVKEKRIVFSEVIDSKINGFAIGVSFSMISLFLLFNDNYFGLKWITYAVGAAFGIVGVAGIGTELDKSQKVKGIRNLVIGIIFSGVWLWATMFAGNNVFVNVVTIPALVFGPYALTRGLFELFYSICLAIVASKQSFGKIVKVFFVFITQLCGLALTILNILKIVGIV